MNINSYLSNWVRVGKGMACILAMVPLGIFGMLHDGVTGKNTFNVTAKNKKTGEKHVF